MTFEELIQKVNTTSAAWVIGYIESLEKEVNRYRGLEKLEPIRSIVDRITDGVSLEEKENTIKEPRTTKSSFLAGKVSKAEAKSTVTKVKEIGNNSEEQG